ncbi:MAG: hypothetical protein Q9220_007697 [cf. Caloplaca sp. 1 TL-2023]
MVLRCFAPFRPNNRIEAWLLDVTRQTPEPLETNKDEVCRAEPNRGITLRSTNSRAVTQHSQRNQNWRPALAEISLPNPLTKRKACTDLPSNPKKRQKAAVKVARNLQMPKSKPPKKSKAIVDDEEEYIPKEDIGTPARREGRPATRQDIAHPQDSAIGHWISKVALKDGPSQGSDASQSSQRSRSRQASRSRKAASDKPPTTPRRAKNLDDGLKSDHVVLEFLERCTPPILLRKVNEVRSRYGLPAAVKELYDELNKHPPGMAIPSTLKKSYEDDGTPRGSKKLPFEYEYSTPANDPWPPQYHPYLKSFVDNIIEDAAFSESGHEYQIVDVVCRISNAFALWPEADSVRSVNVQTVQIEPQQFYLKAPKGNELFKSTIDGHNEGQPSKDSSDSISNDGSKDPSLKRQVDRVMALKVS